MIKKSFPYSLSNIKYFKDDTFYEVHIESITDTRGIWGKIEFFEKDFSQGNFPVIKNRYSPESYFGLPLFDQIIGEGGVVSDYKNFLKSRIETSTGIEISLSELESLFSPIEKKLKSIN